MRGVGEKTEPCHPGATTAKHHTPLGTPLPRF